MKTAEQKRFKVLIVDDNIQNLNILGRMLERDYHVLVARSGQEALRLIRDNESPDIILLDIMMPGMDGYEVCQKLKEDPETAEIPVIFITAMTGIEDEARGLSLGAVDYITKPYQVPIIRARVRTQVELLTSRRERAEAFEGLSRELEAMNELQQRIVPAEPFISEHIRAEGLYIPSGLASGDYFDFFPREQGGLRCVVADVSGHGARAAFIMAMVRTVFHLNDTRNLPLPDLLSRLNAELLDTLGEDGDFITVFAADVDPEKNRLEYVNAGHCPAFFKDDQGFREMESTSGILGVFQEGFEARTLRTDSPWKLLIYTDGFYESKVSDSGIFGYEAFRDLCSEIMQDEEFEVSLLPESVSRAVRGDIEITDDQTALYVESL